MAGEDRDAPTAVSKEARLNTEMMKALPQWTNQGPRTVRELPTLAL
jgi:hypothetical protein